MPGIDRLVSDTVSIRINERLEKNTIKKIERSVFLGNGLSIKLAVENFSLIYDAFKQNQIKNSIIKEIFKEIIIAKKVTNTDYHVKIINKELNSKIFKIISDFESFLIIKSLINNVATTEEIIKITEIPKTSAYRKIQKMIGEGFLIIESREKSRTRFSTKLTCLFKEIIIKIKQNQIEITLIIPEKIYKRSSIAEFI